MADSWREFRSRRFTAARQAGSANGSSGLDTMRLSETPNQIRNAQCSTVKDTVGICDTMAEYG